MAASSNDSELRHLNGRCVACGIAFGGFANQNTGVIRVDRAKWRASCPGAARNDVPGACQELQASLRRMGVLPSRTRRADRS